MKYLKFFEGIYNDYTKSKSIKNELSFEELEKEIKELSYIINRTFD